MTNLAGDWLTAHARRGFRLGVRGRVARRLDNAGGLDPYLASPEEFAALIKRDYAKYAKVIKDVGLKVD